MTIGEIILPNNSPNLIQSLFKGVKNLESSRPKVRKIIAITKDQILGGLLLINGQKLTNKKTIKKIIPKLLFELTFFIVFLIYQ